MFRNVPGCSGMFHVPGFIDGQVKQVGNVFAPWLPGKSSLDKVL